MEAIGTLLDAGVHIALMNGDRDFRCNCEMLEPIYLVDKLKTDDSIGVGGEAISLAVNYKNKNLFGKAGYTDIVVNSSYVGGKVRQFGPFSFSRIYNAGHESTRDPIHITYKRLDLY